jgi:hypothetical protein
VRRQLATPRKRRTRQHVIAAQSVNYVERFIIDAGHTAQRWEADYGYDLVLTTYDEQGYVEPGSVRLQLKAGETLERVGTWPPTGRQDGPCPCSLAAGSGTPGRRPDSCPQASHP